MGAKTAIEWAEATWNPVEGCTKIRTGCKHCYAERIHPRLFGSGPASRPFSQVVLLPYKLEEPLHWRKPRRIFVCSRSDLFHKNVPDNFILRVFQVMGGAFWHRYLLLTKRPERMLDLWPWLSKQLSDEGRAPLGPLWKQLWFGVSCENQEQADKCIPLLLQTPAAVRWVSLEPLLGPINIKPWLNRPCIRCNGTASVPMAGGGAACPRCFKTGQFLDPDQIDWIIVGGESGGSQERALVTNVGVRHATGRTIYKPKPRALEWVRSLRDQCRAAGVPFFFKQWGGPRPTSGGRLLNGREWSEFPR